MNKDEKAASALGADLCSGCGICSYVCPGKAPVAELIRSMRGAADVSVAAVEEEDAGETKDGEAEI